MIPPGEIQRDFGVYLFLLQAAHSSKDICVKVKITKNVELNLMTILVE